MKPYRRPSPSIAAARLSILPASRGASIRRSSGASRVSPVPGAGPGLGHRDGAVGEDTGDQAGPGQSEVITASARRTRVEALRESSNDALTVAGGHQLFGGTA